VEAVGAVLDGCAVPLGLAAPAALAAAAAAAALCGALAGVGLKTVVTPPGNSMCNFKQVCSVTSLATYNQHGLQGYTGLHSPIFSSRCPCTTAPVKYVAMQSCPQSKQKSRHAGAQSSQTAPRAGMSRLLSSLHSTHLTCLY